MSRRHLLPAIVITALIPVAAVLYHRFRASAIASLVTLWKPAQNVVPVMHSDKQTPVLVVGAGLAGLTAAYSALQAGASVRLLERAPKYGGNSIKASSGINGAPTRFQPGPDTTFFSDTVRSAGSRLSTASAIARRDRESLISLLTNQSASAVNFLVDEIGVDLSTVAQLGGHSFPRTHRGGGKLTPGFAIVSSLLEKLKAGGDRFQLITECEVTKLLSAAPEARNGDAKSSSTSELPKVVGVEVLLDGKTQKMLGPVVFATGGFAGDTYGMLSAYRPDLAGLPSTNDARPGAHRLLTDIGAKLIDMSSVQVHPTGFVDPADRFAVVKFLAAEMLRGEGGILLHGGKRFVNEMATREHVSSVIMGDLKPVDTDPLRQWDVQILLDPGACAAAANHVGFYLFKKLMRKVQIKDLDETTRETLADYAKVVKGEISDPFGRPTFGHWTLGPELEGEAEVCVGTVTPIVHFTMGGAVISENAQVMATDLGEDGERRPIEGLWAAGEVTGGIHGDNRLGGSSLLECVVFGRIAGKQAASSALCK